MSQTIHLAGIQASFTTDEKSNIEKISHYVEEAKKLGAQVILPPELFESEYFCREEKDEFFALAKPFENHPTVAHFQKMAKALKVVIPVSFFERENNHYYNSLTMVNTDGGLMGLYRKSHIPDGPGYEEKFYFRPGNTGFKTWKTQFGQIGVGICWDQWYPECARAMMLMGADVLMYPTAIGSEPEDPSLDTKDLWQKAMLGHAVSNVVPVVAANRIGNESGQIFYGHSFAANHRGKIVSELGSKEQGLVHSVFDLDLVRKNRASFGFFRDRRPQLYGALTES